MSDSDVEMRWVAAWNDLYDVIRDQGDVPCQLPDCSIVSPEECRGWLQNSVYAGYHVGVEAGWVGHRRGAIISRWRESDRCSQCQSDDLKVVGIRDVRRPARRGEAATAVAKRIDFQCRECGCEGSILRRIC